MSDSNHSLQASLKRVRAVVRQALGQALQQAWGDGGETVPEALIKAVAAGRGGRGAVAAASRRLFGDQPPLELVVVDTDRIGGYVFESSRPPVLKGASMILANLNRKIEKDYGKQAIFSGGGEALLLVAAGKSEKIRETIEKWFKDETEGALTVTVRALPVCPEDFISEPDPPRRAAARASLLTGTAAVLAHARDRVRREKDQRAPSREAVSGAAQRCESCRDRKGVEELSKYRPDQAEAWRTDLTERERLEAKLCKACGTRWKVGKGKIAGLSLEDIVYRYAMAQRRAEAEGEEPLAAGPAEGKERYIGFLYADGNAMGQLFGGLASLAELRFLSGAVAHVFDQAELRVGGLLAAELGKKHEEGYLSLLGGGDERVWILPAPLAVQVAETLPRWIDEETRGIPDLCSLLQARGIETLTIGTGLVICEHKFPVRYQYELAKDLQKSAKSLYYKNSRSTPEEPIKVLSALDFELVTDGSPMGESLERARGVAYETDDPDFLRTCRPYTAEAFSRLVHRVRSLGEQEMGKSQLYALQSGATEGRAVFRNFLLYQIARNAERYGAWLKAQPESVELGDPEALEGFFVSTLDGGGTGTWIPDALQLAPFLGADTVNVDDLRDGE